MELRKNKYGCDFTKCVVLSILQVNPLDTVHFRTWRNHSPVSHEIDVVQPPLLTDSLALFPQYTSSVTFFPPDSRLFLFWCNKIIMKSSRLWSRTITPTPLSSSISYVLGHPIDKKLLSTINKNAN